MDAPTLDAVARLMAPWRRRHHPIYVDAPPPNAKSGGVRGMNLLAHHLARLGYDALITNAPPPGPTRCASVAIYAGGIVAGNPLGADVVVRYLMNRQNVFRPTTTLDYGGDDIFLCFDPSYALAGRTSFDLYLPLVDRSAYFPPPPGAARRGFALFTNRAKPNLADIPKWVSPTTLLSMDQPRSHSELGEIYRSAVAMVTWERTIAIPEALCCGCPVICIPNRGFHAATYQRRFDGAGLVWGWRRDRLEPAAAEVARFDTIYRGLEHDLDRRIRAIFDVILQRAAQRAPRA